VNTAELFLLALNRGSSPNDYADLRNPDYAEQWRLTPAPTNLGPLVNTAFSEAQPSLSSDGRTLYFTSNRPGGSGGFDLYMTTRTRKKGGR
jgi:Tol biopolymer transport system component